MHVDDGMDRVCTLLTGCTHVTVVVPVDLLGDVIFILKMFIRLITESSGKELIDLNVYSPGHNVEDMSYIFVRALVQ